MLDKNTVTKFKIRNRGLAVIMRRFQFVLLLSLFLIIGMMVIFSVNAAPLALPAAIPSNPVVFPIGNANNVPLLTAVSITYDEDINPSTVSTQTFAVHAMQTGLLQMEYEVSDGTISLNPSQPFKPGELVQVSATTGTLNLSAEGPMNPTVWQFRTATGRGTGLFEFSAQSVGTSSLDVDLGDVDGDGDLDVFALSRITANKVWLNDGNGFFTDSGQNLGDTNGFAVELGDLDGDGDLDAFVVYGIFSGQPNKIYLNDGSGNFSDSGQNLGNARGTDVALGDVDGDGDLDAFVTKQSGEQNAVWLNDGHGIFSDSGQNLGDSYSYSVALGDVDNDGDLDAFIANHTNDTDPNEVWWNDGNGIFTNSGQALGNSGSFGIVLGDLDNDNDLDAFVVNRGANNNQPNKIWLNNGNGIFSDSGQALGNSASVFVDLGDVDGDGDLDAFVVNGTTANHANRIWFNDGNGVFSDNGQPMGNDQSRSVVLGDLNGDGSLDAFVGGWGIVNEIWLNPKATYEIYLPYIMGKSVDGE